MTIPFEPESARVNTFSTPWKVGNVLGTFQSFLKSMPSGGIPSNAETLSVFSSRLKLFLNVILASGIRFLFHIRRAILITIIL